MENRAHKDQCGIQVFIVSLDKVTVMVVGYAMELIVEVDVGAIGRPEEGWKDSWQCFKHGILQAENNENVIRKIGERHVSFAHAFGSMVVSPIVDYKGQWSVPNGKRETEG